MFYNDRDEEINKKIYNEIVNVFAKYDFTIGEASEFLFFMSDEIGRGRKVVPASTEQGE